MRRFVLLLVAAGSISGCAGKTLIVLQNPDTKEIRQCQDDARLFGSAGRVRDCADAYKKAGWIELN